MLRAPTHTPPMEKMLTPVQEKSVENYSDSSDEDEGDNIMLSGSRKIDGQPLSRSESGLSNPISWTLFEADSEVSSLRDSISILSEGEESMSRSFRTSGYSNGSGGDQKNSKEELCEQAHLQNHKGFSQGSDDYNSNGVFNSPTSPQGPIDFFSSSEGTPVRTVYSETNQKPVSDSTVTLRADISTHSSTSHTTSSQGSYSEDFESPDSTLKQANRASMYEKYERYRLANSTSENEPTIEQSQDSTQSTQDSAGTLTGSTPSEGYKTPPTVPSEQLGLYGQDVIGNCGVDKNRRREQWETTRDMQKQVDSGIDERGSPDTRSEKSNSLKRSSLPEVMPMRGLRQFSEPVSFNSRESGLADSPDSESFLGDLPPLNVNRPHSLTDSHSLATHVLRSPTEQPSPQDYEMSIDCATPPNSRGRRSRSSEPDLVNTIRKVSDVEIIISDGEQQSSLLLKDKLGISQESIDDLEDDEEYLTDLSRSTTGPRSLENPTFSSIARHPIQRHTKTTDVPHYDSSERRSRAASVDPPALTSRPSLTNFSPKHEPHFKALADTRVRTSNTSITSPTHSTCASSSASSENELSIGSQGGLSKSLSALSSAESPRTSGKRKKWGKRLQKTFKPALRVFRITPSSTPIPESRIREDIVRDIHLSSLTPENSPSPSELETERVRMMSPETVTAIKKDSQRNMRRSQSFDDILDVNRDEACMPMKVGSMEVVPEPKAKPKKGKLFSSFQSNRHKGKRKESGPDDSPVTLVGMKKKGGSLDSASDTAGSKSPKTRKKSRLPHFV